MNKIVSGARSAGLPLLMILSSLLPVGIAPATAADPVTAPPPSAANGLPTLWIIGDSTVKNHGKGLLGWGDPIKALFDTTRINVENRALGGRSSRTFQTEGLWDKVVAEMKPGDFVLMQMGHNDGGGLTQNQARASLKGTGEETQTTTDPKSGKPEVVHTYGWYMRKYVTDTKAKGATAIVLSPVPRNIWKDNKVARNSGDYGKWAAETAKTEGAFFVDLNDIVAKHYEDLGQEKVKTDYFLTDHTHTTPIGAQLNAASVVEGLKALPDCPLCKYLANGK